MIWQNGIHEENVQIRNMICHYKIRSLRRNCLANLSNEIKAEDSHRPTPHNKNAERSLLIFKAKQERKYDRIEQKSGY